MLDDIIRDALGSQQCDVVEKCSDLPGGPGMYVMEPKYDGYRLLVHVVEDANTLGGAKCNVYTRSLKRHDGKLEHVEREILTMFGKGTVLDGEAVALVQNVEGTFDMRFPHVQSVLNSGTPERAKEVQEFNGKLKYIVFDVLWLEGKDMRSLPLSQRAMELEAHVAKKMPFCQYVALTQRDPASDELHESYVRVGFEGTVSKHVESTYHSNGRGKGWYKRKRQPTVDVVITGFHPGEGKYTSQIGSVKFGQPQGPYPVPVQELVPINGSVYVERGQCSGMDDATRMWLTQEGDALVGKVMEIKHMGVMAGGVKFRHPQFSRMRPDKPVREVIWHDG